jgi:hypothetical protein
MAVSNLERDTMAKSFAIAKTLLLDVLPKLQGTDVIYNSVGGVKETLDQNEMNELPELSGLTKTQMDDGVYALCAVILPAIQNNYAQLSQLAARFL